VSVRQIGEPHRTAELIEMPLGVLVRDSDGPNEPFIRWGFRSLHGNRTYGGTCSQPL